jgi:hypothetical protein
MSDRSGVGLASLAVLESCLIWRVLPWPTPSGEGYTIGNRARFLCVCWRLIGIYARLVSAGLVSGERWKASR